MLICPSHRFAFIHVHRTGGTSIVETCERLLPDTRRALPQHTHAGSALFDADAIRNFTICAMVRNPWDRMFSWYSLFAKFNPRQDHEVISFEEFLYGYPRIACNYGLDEDFRFNQVDCLRDHNGELVTSFVGRYETFARDVVGMFETVGVDVTVNDLSWLNATERTCFREHYTRESREFVAEQCADDIEYFDYQFDAR